MKLPAIYENLLSYEKKIVREQYIKQQNGKCMFCNCALDEDPPLGIIEADIDWGLFPKGFLRYPVHLQHNHETGWTEGAVHAHCNAYMWVYEGK